MNPFEVLGNDEDTFSVSDGESSDIDFFRFKSLVPDAKAILNNSKFNDNKFKSNCSLLACSSTYGFIVAGTHIGFIIGKTKKLRDDIYKTQEGGEIVFEDNIEVTVNQGSVNIVTLTNDQLGLLIGVSGGLLLEYSIHDIVNKKEAEPILSNRFEKEISNIYPNPGEYPDLVAVCLENQNCHIYSLVKKEIVSTIKKITAAGWSPKGKQLACGFNNGRLSTYDIEGALKDYIDPPVTMKANQAEETVNRYVSAILWVENHVFFAIYSRPDDIKDASHTPFIINRKHEGEERYVQLEQVSEFSDSDDHAISHFYLSLIRHLGSNISYLITIANANASALNLVGKETDGQWATWLIEDGGIPRLPTTNEYEDTSPVGLAVDFSASEPWSPSSSGNREKSVSPMPVLFVLTNNGDICAYHYYNSEMVKNGEKFEGMVKPTDLESIPQIDISKTITDDIKKENLQGKDNTPSSPNISKKKKYPTTVSDSGRTSKVPIKITDATAFGETPQAHKNEVLVSPSTSTHSSIPRPKHGSAGKGPLINTFSKPNLTSSTASDSSKTDITLLHDAKDKSSIKKPIKTSSFGKTKPSPHQPFGKPSSADISSTTPFGQPSFISKPQTEEHKIKKCITPTESSDKEDDDSNSSSSDDFVKISINSLKNENEKSPIADDLITEQPIVDTNDENDESDGEKEEKEEEEEKEDVDVNNSESVVKDDSKKDVLQEADNMDHQQQELTEENDSVKESTIEYTQSEGKEKSTMVSDSDKFTPILNATEVDKPKDVSNNNSVSESESTPKDEGMKDESTNTKNLDETDSKSTAADPDIDDLKPISKNEYIEEAPTEIQNLDKTESEIASSKDKTVEPETKSKDESAKDVTTEIKSAGENTLESVLKNEISTEESTDIQSLDEYEPETTSSDIELNEPKLESNGEHVKDEAAEIKAVDESISESISKEEDEKKAVKDIKSLEEEESETLSKDDEINEFKSTSNNKGIKEAGAEVENLDENTLQSVPKAEDSTEKVTDTKSLDERELDFASTVNDLIDLKPVSTGEDDKEEATYIKEFDQQAPENLSKDDDKNQSEFESKDEVAEEKVTDIHSANEITPESVSKDEAVEEAVTDIRILEENKSEIQSKKDAINETDYRLNDRGLKELEIIDENTPKYVSKDEVVKDVVTKVKDISKEEGENDTTKDIKSPREEETKSLPSNNSENKSASTLNDEDAKEVGAEFENIDKNALEYTPMERSLYKYELDTVSMDHNLGNPDSLSKDEDGEDEKDEATDTNYFDQQESGTPLNDDETNKLETISKDESVKKSTTESKNVDKNAPESVSKDDGLKEEEATEFLNLDQQESGAPTNNGEINDTDFTSNDGDVEEAVTGTQNADEKVPESVSNNEGVKEEVTEVKDTDKNGSETISDDDETDRLEPISKDKDMKEAAIEINNINEDTKEEAMYVKSTDDKKSDISSKDESINKPVSILNDADVEEADTDTEIKNFDKKELNPISENEDDMAEVVEIKNVGEKEAECTSDYQELNDVRYTPKEEDLNEAVAEIKAVSDGKLENPTKDNDTSESEFSPNDEGIDELATEIKTVNKNSPRAVSQNENVKEIAMDIKSIKKKVSAAPLKTDKMNEPESVSKDKGVEEAVTEIQTMDKKESEPSPKGEGLKEETPEIKDTDKNDSETASNDDEMDNLESVPKDSSMENVVIESKNVDRNTPESELKAEDTQIVAIDIKSTDEEKLQISSSEEILKEVTTDIMDDEEKSLQTLANDDEELEKGTTEIKITDEENSTYEGKNETTAYITNTDEKELEYVLKNELSTEIAGMDKKNLLTPLKDKPESLTIDEFVNEAATDTATTGERELEPIYKDQGMKETTAETKNVDENVLKTLTRNDDINELESVLKDESITKTLVDAEKELKSTSNDDEINIPESPPREMNLNTQKYTIKDDSKEHIPAFEEKEIQKTTVDNMEEVTASKQKPEITVQEEKVDSSSENHNQDINQKLESKLVNDDVKKTVTNEIEEVVDKIDPETVQLEYSDEEDFEEIEKPDTPEPFINNGNPQAVPEYSEIRNKQEAKALPKEEVIEASISVENTDMKDLDTTSIETNTNQQTAKLQNTEIKPSTLSNEESNKQEVPIETNQIDKNQKEDLSDEMVTPPPEKVTNETLSGIINENLRESIQKTGDERKSQSTGIEQVEDKSESLQALEEKYDANILTETGTEDIYIQNIDYSTAELEIKEEDREKEIIVVDQLKPKPKLIFDSYQRKYFQPLQDNQKTEMNQIPLKMENLYIDILLEIQQTIFEEKELHNEISFLRKSKPKDITSFEKTTWRLGNVNDISMILNGLVDQLAEVQKYRSQFDDSIINIPTVDQRAIKIFKKMIDYTQQLKSEKNKKRVVLELVRISKDLVEECHKIPSFNEELYEDVQKKLYTQGSNTVNIPLSYRNLSVYTLQHVLRKIQLKLNKYLSELNNFENEEGICITRKHLSFDTASLERANNSAFVIRKTQLGDSLGELFSLSSKYGSRSIKKTDAI